MQPAPKNLSESLTLKTRISSSDAVAQLGQALGKSDAEIGQMFPGLQGFKGQVHLDILTADRNPEGTGKGDMVVVTGLGETHADLFYGHYPNTGETVDFVKKMPNHPRNRIQRVLKDSWAEQVAPFGDPDAADKFLSKGA